MAKMTPDQAAKKWVRRTQAATEDVRLGVDSVTVAPTAQAAAKKDKMLSRVTEAVTSGKWERGLKRVSLEDWKQATIQKGIPRISAGVQESEGKMTTFMSELLPYIEAGQREQASMPDTTLEDSINRMTTWTRRMAKFRRS